MKFNLFGAPREKHSSDEESERPRDSSKRRTLKQLGAVALTSGLVGSSMESVPRPLGTFAERFHAAEQLKLNGITDFQRQAYKPVISETLARGLTPIGYNESLKNSSDTHSDSFEMKHEALDEILRVVGGIGRGFFVAQKEQNARIAEKMKSRGIAYSEEYVTRSSKNRIDALRMYLGLPQLNATFGISEFKPAESKEDHYYYRLNNFLQNYMSFWGLDTRQAIQWITGEGEDAPKPYPRESEGHREWLAGELETGKKHLDDDLANFVMGAHLLTKGHDEQGTYISYYDRWDLGDSFEGKEGVIGKPYEIYDRIYYDPVTFEVVEPKAVSPEDVA